MSLNVLCEIPSEISRGKFNNTLAHEMDMRYYCLEIRSGERRITVRIAKEFILRDIAGDYVLVPTGATTQEFNGLITLSGTAKFIWENIEKANSLEEMVAWILDEYEIDEETALKDAVSFINQLVQTGFVECTKEDRSW